MQINSDFETRASVHTGAIALGAVSIPWSGPENA
jgi:hypothetical protein